MSVFIQSDKRLVLWNKINSAASVNNSIIGANLTAGGSMSFTTGKYNNGFQVGATGNGAAYGMQLPANSIDDIGVITYEFWYKHDVSFSGTANYARFFHFSTDSGAYNHFFVRSDSYKIYINIWDGPSPATNYETAEWNFASMNALDAYFELASAGGDGAFHHYAIVIDKDATQVFTFYKDGVSLGAPDTTTSGGTIPDPLPQTELIYIGVHQSATNQGMCGIMDNLKIWNYVKTDFTDRFNEIHDRAGSEFGITNNIAKPNKRLILWNKCGNASEINKSQIGSAGTINGTPTYNTAKFNDGTYSNSDSNYLTFSDGGIDPNKITFEAWFKTDWSITDGVPSDSQFHVIYFWRYDANNYIVVSTRTTNFFFNVVVGGTSYTATFTTGITWSASTDVHLAVVINRNGIDGGSDTFRFYINNSLAASTTTTIADQTNRNGIFYTHIHPDAAGRVLDGIIDNLKIYNYAKLDFSDKDTEYPQKINGTNLFNTSLKQLVLWSKLNNSNSIINPVIGAAGVLNGGTFETMTQYTPGLLSNATGEGATFTNHPDINQAGCYEFFTEPQFSSTSTTTAQFINSSTNIAHFPRIQWHIDTPSTTEFRIFWGSVFFDTSGVSFSSGQSMHMAVVWDKNGIDGGSDTMRFYIDNVLKGSTTSSISGVTYSDGIRVGNHQNLAQTANAKFSNFKLWNYAKTNFLDRYVREPINLKEVITV